MTEEEEEKICVKCGFPGSAHLLDECTCVFVPYTKEESSDDPPCGDQYCKYHYGCDGMGCCSGNGECTGEIDE